MSDEYTKSINILKNNISYSKLKNELKSLPKDLQISTMTICFMFNTNLNIMNISKYLKLDKNIVISIGKRTLIKKNKKKKDIIVKEKKNTIIGKKRGRKPKIKSEIVVKKNQKKKTFYNQISLKILVSGKEKDKPVNVKLFNNGSIQMTGCVTLYDSFDAIINCIKILNTKRYIISNNEIVNTPFSKNKLYIKDISNYKIAMINSSFKLPFYINRTKLFNNMLQNNLDTVYDRNVHASVIVKYKYNKNDNNKDITILIFEKGSIIITGANNSEQIKETYQFTNKYLLENYKDIVNKNINSLSEISKFLDL